MYNSLWVAISYDYADSRWGVGNSYEYNMIILVFVFILAHNPAGACGLVRNGQGNHKHWQFNAQNCGPFIEGGLEGVIRLLVDIHVFIY